MVNDLFLKGGSIFRDSNGRTIMTHSLDEDIESLRHKFQRMSEQLQYERDKRHELELELNRQQEEWKDECIHDLEKQRDEARADLSRGFGITEEEQKAISDWERKHIEEKHNGHWYAGAIGGRFSYHFVPTSIGVFGSVHCICGDKFDFQEEA